MAKYIANPFTKIPKHPKSHVHGWAIYWSNMLDAQIYRGDYSDITPFDTVYIDHGVNFSGGLNLFGGLDDDIALNLIKLIDSKCDIVSLDIQMPDYPSFLEQRIGAKSTSDFLTQELIDEIRLKFFQYSHIDSVSLKKPWLTIGDSHSTAYAQAGSAVSRTNGQTLYGAMRKPFPFVSKPYKELEGITLVYGSIDIRHHLMRQNDPVLSAKQLCKEFINYGRTLSLQLNVPVQLSLPVPIEYEERKLPKTGYYKGTPFYGSRNERNILLHTFEHDLVESGMPLVAPPIDWYHMDPEEYAKEIMEFGGSVHIAPVNYRSVQQESKQSHQRWDILNAI